MAVSVLGTRIRQRRREVGITQAELARRVGISGPYLNLIEWNKRRIAGALLRKIATALNLTLDDIDDVSERQLMANLTELSHQSTLANLQIEREQTQELIARFPGWARAISALAKSEREASARAQVLSDRLSNDPFLGETVHRMLSRIAAIRSAAEILSEVSDIPDFRRIKFNEIVRDESEALTETAEALATYLDKAQELEPTLTPVDEVQALFDANDNHFEDVENLTADIALHLTDPQPGSRQLAARALVRDRLTANLADMVDAFPQIETVAAHKRALNALQSYAVNAVLMPMHAFTTRANSLRFDIEALADAFAVDIDAVCQRLTALTRDKSAPRFGYLRANAAGRVLTRFGLTDISVPDFATACPLWVLYRAQQSPEMVIRQRALFPSGARFVFIARARHTGTTGFDKPRHYVTDMVVLSEADSTKTVYAPGPSVALEEVGPGCRSCPRFSCEHRVESPLGD